MIDETTFVQGEWTEFYKDAQKAISPNAPQLQCNIILFFLLLMRIILESGYTHISYWHPYN
jgi:hypothetical protein